MSHRPRPGWLRAAPVSVGLVLVSLAMAWSRANPSRPMAGVTGTLPFLSGTGPPGSYGRHSWTLRNDGPSALKLRTRFTSGHCGFTLWQRTDHVIEPGSHVIVWLTWPAPETSDTPYSHHAEVWTNDPERPRIRFRIVGRTGTVLPSPPILTRP